MNYSIPPKSLTRLRSAFAAVRQADQLFRVQIAAVAEMLRLDADDPSLKLNLETGAFVTDEEPVRVAEESANGTVATVVD